MKKFFAELLQNPSPELMLDKQKLFCEEIEATSETKNAWIDLGNNIFQRIQKADNIKSHAFPDIMATEAYPQDNSCIHPTTSRIDVYVKIIVQKLH